MSIRILLADDHQLLWEGLRSLIEKEADMEVVGEAADGRMAVRLVRELAPDVVVMDIGMPDLNGVEATRQILARAPGVKVIALSMHSDRQFVASMFGAGAVAHVTKGSAFRELACIIRSVVKNHARPNPAVAGAVH